MAGYISPARKAVITRRMKDEDHFLQSKERADRVIAVLEQSEVPRRTTMHASGGLLTTWGWTTSHYAGTWTKPCPSLGYLTVLVSGPSQEDARALARLLVRLLESRGMVREDGTGPHNIGFHVRRALSDPDVWEATFYVSLNLLDESGAPEKPEEKAGEPARVG